MRCSVQTNEVPQTEPTSSEALQRCQAGTLASVRPELIRALLCYQTAGSLGSSSTGLIVPIPFKAGDQLGMRWGSNNFADSIVIQAYLIVTMDG